MEMYIGIIYKYTNRTNGKVYIGKTINEDDRKRNHKRCDGRISKFHRAILKYGWSNFNYEVLHRRCYVNIDDCNTDLDLLETYYILLYDSFNNGYNCTYGGDGCLGYRHDNNTKLLLSKLRVGENNPMFGKHHNKETKEKIQKINSRKVISQYSIDGEFIRDWISAKEIERTLKFPHHHIISCCKGEVRQSHNYIWQFRDEPHKYVPNLSHCKRIIQLNVNGDIVNEWDSITEAANKLGIKRVSINSCLKGRIKTYKGYNWKYKE